MTRPYPPLQDNAYADDEEFADSEGLLHFEPANNDLWPWIEDTFLNPRSKLYNQDHEHLSCFRPPKISFLWAYTKCLMKGREVLEDVKKMAILANSKPELGRASIAQACGTCLLKVV